MVWLWNVLIFRFHNSKRKEKIIQWSVVWSFYLHCMLKFNIAHHHYVIIVYFWFLILTYGIYHRPLVSWQFSVFKGTTKGPIVHFEIETKLKMWNEEHLPPIQWIYEYIYIYIYIYIFYIYIYIFETKQYEQCVTYRD